MYITLSNNRQIGNGQPTFIIAELGINHNGSLDLCKNLIDEAVKAGCDAVKLQKQTPETCIPKELWSNMRDTPWGQMTYIDYRKKLELSIDEYYEIDKHCKKKGILWFASCWDQESVDFIQSFDPPLYKASSASLTDIPLLKKLKSTGKPVILSTGMSTPEEIKSAVAHVGTDNLLLAHSTSTMPCALGELNLNMIKTLKKWYPTVPVGYSGHENGTATTIAATSIGAQFVERHVTLNKKMWGSDQAVSLEPDEMQKLVQDIRAVDKAMGDGVKRVYTSEIQPMHKQRRVIGLTNNV